MKVSEVTVKNLADYLKLDYETLDPEEFSELETFLTSLSRITPGLISLKSMCMKASSWQFLLCFCNL